MNDLKQCEQRILELESLLEISDRKSDVLTSLLMEANAEYEGSLNRVERSEKNFRAIFETAPEPIYLIDINTGRILDCNEFTLSWLGYSRTELISMPAGSIVADKAGVTEDCDEKATYRERMALAEWCFRRKDGSLVTADVAGTPLEYEGRECFAVLVHDITERKRVEKDLIKAREAAESANHAKSQFLANMSHELRTPMNAILGYSQLMQHDASLHRDQREYLEIINRSGEHLLALINDVLEISKIEARRVTSEPTTFDLPALIRDLAVVFRFRTEAKGLEFGLEGVDDVPRYVISDESKVRQILINLLGNAVKFTEKGGIILRVAAARRTSGEMGLKVEVEDTGPGIAEDEREMVFQPFEQGETGRHTKGGTGLGLAISREYARMLGGDLTVAGNVGEGSVFRLETGIREGKEIDLRERFSKRRIVGLAEGQPDLRILVVEDGEENRTLLIRLLQMAGMEVREAVNGFEAVETAEKWRPHFIWMDIRMPVMDGLEATRRIKSTKAGKDIPIAALTASAMEEERGPILAAGCDDFVRKPYREHEIFDVMAKHLRLEYVYEDEQTDEAPAEPEAESTVQRLAGLAPHLRSELCEAVLRLDMPRTSEVIETIAAQDAPLGTVLKTVAENLDYDRLLALLDDEGTHPGE